MAPHSILRFERRFTATASIVEARDHVVRSSRNRAGDDHVVVGITDDANLLNRRHNRREGGKAARILHTNFSDGLTEMTAAWF